jgi:thiamine kinase-like enzyme
MNTLAVIDNPFSFVKAGHPLYAHVERARSLMNSEPYSREIGRIAPDGEALTIRTLLKCHRTPEKRCDFKWVYFLFQSQAEGRPVTDRALTLFYRANEDRLDMYEFPQDPYLPTMSAYFEQLCGNNSGPKAQDFTVLRYVPRRRLTYRISDSGETGKFRVGKFVRQSELNDTYDKLSLVSATANQQQSLFTVTAPLGVDEKQGVFFQAHLNGQNLAHLIKDDNFEDLLFAVGAIHREIHQLHVPGVPQWEFDSILKELKRRVELIAYLCPEMAPFLGEVQAVLVKSLPTIDRHAFTFCHGDFGCNQVLTEGGQWSVIDFDGCRSGDRYREIARLLAFLKHNVPFFLHAFRDPTQSAETLLEQASASYLRGYQERSKEALNWKRLLWYQTVMEIHYLARTLQRDLYHPVAFERTIRCIQDLTDRFKSEKGGDF